MLPTSPALPTYRNQLRQVISRRWSVAGEGEQQSSPAQKGTSMHPMARRDGFTLLEVTIVLLIIVGMLSIAWPRMQTAMSRSDLRNAALVVKRTLASARRQAVESGQQIHVVFSDGSNQIQVCSKLPKSEDRI